MDGAETQTTDTPATDLSPAARGLAALSKLGDLDMDSDDLGTDEVLDLAWRTAAPGTVLIVDGLFLHRDELVGFWDFSVFLDAPFEVTVARMARRDGTHPDPRHPSVARYVGGQRLYFAACRPRRRADVVIDNRDLARPVAR